MQPSILPHEEGGRNCHCRLANAARIKAALEKADAASLEEQRAAVRHRARRWLASLDALSHPDRRLSSTTSRPPLAGWARGEPLITRRVSSSTPTWAGLVSGCGEQLQNCRAGHSHNQTAAGQNDPLPGEPPHTIPFPADQGAYLRDLSGLTHREKEAGGRGTRANLSARQPARHSVINRRPLHVWVWMSQRGRRRRSQVHGRSSLRRLQPTYTQRQTRQVTGRTNPSFLRLLRKPNSNGSPSSAHVRTFLNSKSHPQEKPPPS